MHAAYAALTTVVNSPVTLAVSAALALIAVRPLVRFDDRLKQRKRL